VQTHPATSYRFGPFEVNAPSGELLKNGRPIRLQEQPYRLLLVLLETPGEVVSREELRSRLWPGDTFVDFDGSLRVAVRKLREALDDDAEKPRFIETIPKRGYRFLVSEVRIMDTAPEVAELNGNRAPLQTEATPVATRQQTNPLFRYAIAAAALILAVGGVLLWQHRTQAKPLTSKDVLVLADFTNTTGDAMFDETLRQGLAIQLEQSPFLSILSEGRIQQTLKMMGQPVDAKLTPPIARELCQRAGSSAMLNGSIAQIGTRYLLTLEAANCANGETLASAEAQANDKNQVLDTLGKTASEMRNKLGESLSTVQRFDTPLEQATTGSLEALQAYTLGRKASARADWSGAIPFFQRAIALDPKFAMAYARLGTNYRNRNEFTLASENLLKAYEMREQVSAPERFYIEGHYYDYGLGNLEKAVRAHETWAQAYPRDWVPRVDLCAAYFSLGELDKALSEGLETTRLNPTGVGYNNLFNAYFRLGRRKEARATAEEAEAKQLDSEGLHNAMYQLAFVENDAAEMAQQSLWTRGKPGMADEAPYREALTAAYYGKQEQARNLSRQAVALAKREEKNEVAALYEGDGALQEALFGNRAKAIERSEAALEISKGWEVQRRAALALAFAGDVRAQTLADDLVNRFPDNTLVQSSFVPTIRAQLALHRKEPSSAIEMIQAATPYELSSVGKLYSVYVRGEGYLAARRANEAAAEFQKILNHREIVVNLPIGALAHLGLGRAYALSGDRTKARAAYEDFLGLWKDADPDIPVLQQAKAEYAKLQ
jgi:eukaryotic-like serine/threonine-protein kinase